MSGISTSCTEYYSPNLLKCLYWRDIFSSKHWKVNLCLVNTDYSQGTKYLLIEILNKFLVLLNLNIKILLVNQFNLSYCRKHTNYIKLSLRSYISGLIFFKSSAISITLKPRKCFHQSTKSYQQRCWGKFWKT